MMLLVQDPTTSLEPSWGLIALMLAMLAAAAFVFWRLTHAWTRGRRLAALREWARGAGMQVHTPPTAALPAPLAGLGPEPRALLTVEGGGVWLVQFETQSAQVDEPPRRWHALVHHLPAALPRVGLRPAHAPVSLLDRVPLRAYPGLIPPERFIVIGQERAAAEALATGSVRALLPADIGLVVIDDALVLDFSTRPFDGIEFSRLLEVARQVIPHLPQPTRV